MANSSRNVFAEFTKAKYIFSRRMSSYHCKHLKLKHFGHYCIILVAELSQPNYNSELPEVISSSDSLTIGFNAVQVR